MATIIVWTEGRLRRAVELEAARRNLSVSETAEQILRAALAPAGRAPSRRERTRGHLRMVTAEAELPGAS